MGKHRECGEEKKCKRGHRGEPGKQGEPGQTGAQGQPGQPGQNGQNGQIIYVPVPCNTPCNTPCGGKPCDQPCNVEEKCPKIKCNPTDIYVGKGAGYDFETIQGAIDSLKGRRLCPCTIHVAPGDYTENIHIDSLDAASNNQLTTYPSLGNYNGVPYPTPWRGLQIVGDSRRYNNATYINGYALAGTSYISTVYTMTGTADGNPFEYNLLISEGFGSIPPVSGITGPIAVCEPYLATAPVTNGSALNGHIVLCGRGSNGFEPKTINILAAAPSALAVVIINDLATPIGAPSGNNPSVLLPTFTMNQADGNALLAATSISNVTIAVATPLTTYFPPTGTNYGLVTITQMGPQSIYVTLDATCVQADVNISPYAPVSENPNFGPFDATAPLTTLGLSIGDRVMLSQNSLADVTDLSNVAGSYFQYGQRQILTIVGFGASVGSPVNNQLFFKEVLNFPMTTGVSLTLLPNVRIIGQPTYSWNTCDSTTVNTETVDSIFTINNTGISIQGLWIDVNANLPFGTFLNALRIIDSEVQYSNIIITDSGHFIVESISSSPPVNAVVFQSLSGGGGFGLVCLRSTISGLDGFTGENGNNGSVTVIGWSSGVSLTDSTLNISNLQVLGIESVGVSAYLSKIGSANTQVLGCYGIYEAGGYGIQLNGSIHLNQYLALISDIFGSGVLLVQNASFNNSTPAVRVQNTVTGVAGIDYSYTAGISVSSGSEFVIERGIYSNTVVGSSVVSSLYDQPTLTAYIIDNTSNIYGLPPLNTAGVLVFRGGSFIADCCVYFYNNGGSVEVDIQANPGSTVSIANPSYFGMPPSTLPMGCGCVPITPP